MAQSLLWAGGVLLLVVTLLWLLSLYLRDAGIADIFWGAGFVLVNWLAFLRHPSAPSWAHWLLSGLVTLWGLRLSLHIFLRNRGRPEDFRYAAWREQHGRRWIWRSYLQVFLLQGGLLWLISIPLIAAHSLADRPSALLAGAGALVWAVGFFFEAVGDWQLARFKSDPANRGKLMTTGLWRYTRHPNYFGDAAQWWGFYLIAASLGAWWTVFSPLLMTFLLVRVSGVRMLEQSMSRRPGYAEYMRRTSAFLPWFPRKK